MEAGPAEADALGGSEGLTGDAGLLARFVANHVRDYYAVETDGRGWVLVKEAITPEVISQHLAGSLTAGIYTTRASDDTCRWGCWDLDTLDATAVYRLTAVLDMPYLVEHTGGRGRHVWVFWKDPVPAYVARAYVQGKANEAGLSAAEVDIFPRQDSVKGGLGNLVRLPLGVSKKTGDRSRIEMGTWEFAPPPPTPEATTPVLVNPVPPQGTVQAGWIAALTQEGEAEGGRNNALNRLAYWMVNRGFDQEVVAEVLKFVNENRFSSPLDDDELAKLTRRR